MSRDRQSLKSSPSRPVGGRRADAAFLVDVVDDGAAWRGIAGLSSLIEDAAAALAAHPLIAPQLPAAACLALSDDEAVRQLNASYRGIDKTTNVLSFPAGRQPAGNDDAAPFIGDIALAAETVHREALEQDIPLAHHIQHLVIHGLLHLLGYDHESEADATVMETIETEALTGLGVPNPYCPIGTTEQTS